MTRIVVLASGSGSNLQALLDAERAHRLSSGTIVGVISDRPDAHALVRAATAGVTSVALPLEASEERVSYDRRLLDAITVFQPDLVVLAGWMRLLTSTVVGAVRVINLHPALPGELPGIRAIERAHAEFLAGERQHTGVMVHDVPDEGVDCGPVLASEMVPINHDDSLDDLAQRIHDVEHRLLVATVAQLCSVPPDRRIR